MRTVKLRDQGGLHIWATIPADGGLLIQGQDLGGYPGAGEYEYAIRVAEADMPTVRAALDATDGDDLLSLLEAAGEPIVRRGERAWLEGLGIAAQFWSRVEPGEALSPETRPTGEAPPVREVSLPAPPLAPIIEADDDDLLSPADRFTLSRAWWIIGQLARRHPTLVVSRVVDDDQNPLLIVHDTTETIRVQFDLPAWIQYDTPGGLLRRITWSEVFAQTDPLAVVRTIETEAGLGAPIEAADSPRSLVYRTIGCALALGLDSAATWQAVHARVEVADPDTSDWELFDALPTGTALAENLIDAALERAESEGVFMFHQPVWALLRDLEPVALLDVDGSVHTAQGEVDLVLAFEEAERSVTTMTAALFGRHLP